MTLTRERVEELRTWALHADTPMSDDFRGERLSPTTLLALLDAWEEQERIKLGDISRIMGELPSVIDPAKLRRPLTTADEDRIVARALREVAACLIPTNVGVTPETSKIRLRQRADELEGKA